jgi:hypothetical protein
LPPIKRLVAILTKKSKKKKMFTPVKDKKIKANKIICPRDSISTASRGLLAVLKMACQIFEPSSGGKGIKLKNKRAKFK